MIMLHSVHTKRNGYLNEPKASLPSLLTEKNEYIRLRLLQVPILPVPHLAHLKACQ